MVRRRRRTPSGRTLEWIYTWDAYDRLARVVTPNGDTWRYRHDAVGRRISKQRENSPDRENSLDEKVSGDETHFAWDGATLVEAHSARTPQTAETITTFDYLPRTFTPVAQRTRTLPAGNAATANRDGHAYSTASGRDGPVTLHACARRWPRWWPWPRPRTGSPSPT
jgi:YD repeat-containing protein